MSFHIIFKNCPFWFIVCFAHIGKLLIYFYFYYMGFFFIVSKFLFRIKPICYVFKVCLNLKLLRVVTELLIGDACIIIIETLSVTSSVGTFCLVYYRAYLFWSTIVWHVCWCLCLYYLIQIVAKNIWESYCEQAILIQVLSLI